MAALGVRSASSSSSSSWSSRPRRRDAARASAASAAGGGAVRTAADAAELRACAAVRTAAFYAASAYPEGRSEFAIRSSRRMKLDAEWNALEERLARTEPGYADLFVTPLLYVVSRDADADGALSEGLDMSAMLPDLLALGTLDLNQGRALPAEEAHGARPAEGEGDPGTERAYLSNVAVAPGARRRGVARALVDAARERARDAGVRHLYVHAAVDNPAAQALYLACGFEVEHEEPGAYAESLGRPARWLLHQEL